MKQSFYRAKVDNSSYMGLRSDASPYMGLRPDTSTYIGLIPDTSLNIGLILDTNRPTCKGKYRCNPEPWAHSVPHYHTDLLWYSYTCQLHHSPPQTTPVYTHILSIFLI